MIQFKHRHKQFFVLLKWLMSFVIYDKENTFLILCALVFVALLSSDWIVAFFSIHGIAFPCCKVVNNFQCFLSWSVKMKGVKGSSQHILCFITDWLCYLSPGHHHFGISSSAFICQVWSVKDFHSMPFLKLTFFLKYLAQTFGVFFFFN